jgi:hypothetical protein
MCLGTVFLHTDKLIQQPDKDLLAADHWLVSGDLHLGRALIPGEKDTTPNPFVQTGMQSTRFPSGSLVYIRQQVTSPHKSVSPCLL